MFCPNCGHKLPDNSAFCDNCGVKIALHADSDAAADKKADPVQPDALFSAGSDPSEQFAADVSRKKPAPSAKKAPAKERKTAPKPSKKAAPKKAAPKASSKKASYEWDDDDDDAPSGAPLIIALIVVVIAIALIVVLFLKSGSFSLFSKKNSTPGTTTAAQADMSETSTVSSAVAAVTETPTATPTPTSTPTPTPKPEPTPEPTPAEEDWIIPGISTREITSADLDGLSEDQVWKAKNELYARHGYTFNNEELKAYFSQKSWYTPDPNFTSDSDPSEFGMSELEIRNANMINSYEQDHGYSH